LDLTGATAGWIGLARPRGLTIAARRGEFSDSWLTFQQGNSTAWGFELGDAPTLLNDLPPLPLLGEPGLRNLLSSPLQDVDGVRGQVVLANKSTGFTSHDAVVLQTAAHLLVRQFAANTSIELPPELYHRLVECVEQGVVVVNQTGRLVYANSAWARWTGFAREELMYRTPPFPFWVSYRELAGMNASTRLVPFRHRDQTMFWCEIDTFAHHCANDVLTVTLLRRVPEPDVRHVSSAIEMSRQTVADSLPVAAAADVPHWCGADWLVLLVYPDRAIEFWNERWERLTGFSSSDLCGVSGDVVLDWLFPQQRDRNFVADLLHRPNREAAQASLEVAGRNQSQSLLCTFLPLTHPAWLLLVCEQLKSAAVDSPDARSAHQSRPLRNAGSQEPQR
jgi:PAS domain-containing protein